MTTCKRVIYSGHVQGVGFGMTAYRLAQSHAVHGFVRNLPDGTVELLAEGEPAHVDSCLADLDSVMGAYIQNADVREERHSRRTGFQILH